SGKPVPRPNLHLTLIFLCACTRDEQAAAESVADRTDAAAFSVVMRRLEYWRGPRIQVLAPAELPPSLERLQSELQAGLARAGLRIERQPYRPHITVSRKATPSSPVTLNGEPVHFDRFHLFLSSPGPTGVHYTSLRCWPLRPA
ncbi:MAG: RNA 2',3'-cyclic phosphodiesterase, partial [Ectothiorhodospiraceae bacterium]|nr:RNA 2',3'-cyclic phosphodiesterase [Ectothiorhodospiraceae bacterium]